MKFTPGVKEYLIYFTIHILTETLDNSIPIISDKNIIQNVTQKIDVIYKQIKNEIKPDTDYLFNNSFTNNNLEKTIAKLDKMNSYPEWSLVIINFSNDNYKNMSILRRRKPP